MYFSEANLKKRLIISFWGIICYTLHINAQNSIDIDATFFPSKKAIVINQNLSYLNNSSDTLQCIYLNDWNHSFSNKNTPLAKRFEEEFSIKFHIAKNQERGFTTIDHIEDLNKNLLKFYRLETHPDIIKVELKTPLQPYQSYRLNLSYELTLPDAKFTDYGFSKKEDFELKHWYITPSVYNGKWQFYSHKNLDNLFIPKSDLNIRLKFPKQYQSISELDLVSKTEFDSLKIENYQGKDRVDTHFVLRKEKNTYKTVVTNQISVLTDVDDDNLKPYQKALVIDKVISFLKDKLGGYPHNKLMISSTEYNKDPIYGLNQLPKFISPFPSQLNYELKILKTGLKKYIENILLFNPRKDYWLSDGLQIYFLIKYVEAYYPEVKLLGNLANIWGVNSFHAADLDFNFQYYLFFMESARRNNDQPLTTSKDALIKFNANIASKYKAGVGLRYLDDFTENQNLEHTIKAFIKLYKLKEVNTKQFEQFTKQRTTKDIDWFFRDYVETKKKIDFKIKSLSYQGDSTVLTIKNKRQHQMPVSLFSIKNDTIIDKVWVEKIDHLKTISIPKTQADRFVLDDQNIIPELNQRDNFLLAKKSFITNKPLQFRLFKDIEDPNYNQIFLMPLFQFKNIYDGLTLGTKMYNKTILFKRFNFSISPQYATRSKTITGSTSFSYTHNFENQDFFNLIYGFSAQYQSFAQDAFFTSFNPFVRFIFRDHKDLRSDVRDIISLRYVGINRQIGANATVDLQDQEPDYGVVNLRYVHRKPGIINYSRFFSDLQFANNFSKLSMSYEYRNLSKTNRNFNFRWFGGLFLSNKTDPNSNFFSFALDRPTDYLFDFNYLGRSEASGLFSQQIIIAEGGFKSILNTPFANQWITTASITTSIWRYIQAYVDLGLVKNREMSPNFVYDSGIRLNLVEDYFEIYFPIYSNLGWEIGQPNYQERIRFMFTVNPKVLFGLFRRKWF